MVLQKMGAALRACAEGWAEGDEVGEVWLRLAVMGGEEPKRATRQLLGTNIVSCGSSIGGQLSKPMLS